MSFEVVMPRLGWNMEKGTLVKWLKADGEYVQAGEALFVVEADKASQEVEALESGILRIPADSPRPGAEVPVGTLLGYLLQPGESDVPAQVRPARPRQEVSPPRPVGETDARPRPPAVPIAPAAPAISPRARRVAAELGVDWTGLVGSGRTGRIVERDVRTAAARLVERRAEIPAAEATQVAVSRSVGALVKVGTSTAPTTTLATEADVTELVRVQRQLADAPPPAPSIADLLVKWVAKALTEQPAMNVRMEGDTVVQSAIINIGVAVDTGQGIMIPVLHDLSTKSLSQIAVARTALTEVASSGRIDAADLQGCTLVLTDLGAHDIDIITPIVDLPECPVLGVGRIVPKQVVIDADAGQVAIRRMMFLSLTFDRRMVDGATAARFLSRVKQLIERPHLSLLTWRVTV